MSKSARVVPHRPRKEDARGREVADLRRKNNQLERVVKRLRKEIDKRLEVEVDREEVAMVEQEMTVSTLTCPECNDGEIKVIELGERTFHVCPTCKFRRKA